MKCEIVNETIQKIKKHGINSIYQVLHNSKENKNKKSATVQNERQRYITIK